MHILPIYLVVLEMPVPQRFYLNDPSQHESALSLTDAVTTNLQPFFFQHYFFQQPIKINSEVSMFYTCVLLKNPLAILDTEGCNIGLSCGCNNEQNEFYREHKSL